MPTQRRFADERRSARSSYNLRCAARIKTPWVRGADQAPHSVVTRSKCPPVGDPGGATGSMATSTAPSSATKYNAETQCAHRPLQRRDPLPVLWMLGEGDRDLGDSDRTRDEGWRQRELRQTNEEPVVAPSMGASTDRPSGLGRNTGTDSPLSRRSARAQAARFARPLRAGACLRRREPVRPSRPGPTNVPALAGCFPPNHSAITSR